MNGVTINGKHSYRDFGLYLQPKSIPVPAAKVSKVSIKGADGEIDLSTSLTDGDMKYGNRVIELDFVLIGFGDLLNEKLDYFTDSVHGQEVKLIFDDDPRYYYVGRCEITDRVYNKGHVVISCDFACEPYKYDLDVTTVSKAIDENRTLIITNKRKWVVPTITASAGLQMMYQGRLINLAEGRRVYEDVILRDGDNVLAFSGNGVVTIEYQQGVL